MIYWEKNKISRDLNEIIPIVTEFKKHCFRTDPFKLCLDVLDFIITETMMFSDKKYSIKCDNLLHEKNLPNFIFGGGFII